LAEVAGSGRQPQRGDRSMQYTHAVFIARLQPPHLAHIQVIERALDKAQTVIVVLGSHRSAANVRNPFSAKQREEMVRRCFDYENGQRLTFIAVRDQPYNDTNWMAEVHQKVAEVTEHSSRIALVGHMKDRTSFYLEFFPQWEFVDLGLMHKGINATVIRDQYFAEGPEGREVWQNRHWTAAVHQGVQDYLRDFQGTDDYERLHDQWVYVRDYAKQWESTPFPPTFVTTDTVCVKSGHVLLIRRGFNPGKGLLALPGGFIDQDRTLLDCAIRELKEETRIGIDQRDLREHVRDREVFAYPERSSRGRTITHAYYIKLPDGGILPRVKGGDDAVHGDKGALWMPLGDLHLHETEFFEDHLDIIEHFTSR
jgi:bifunctional NMN adenylyltransferase/nudix hydrolase